MIGFRKVWREPSSSLNYYSLIDQGGHYEPHMGLDIDWKNFWMQLLNCIMICSISLQTEIFYSFGYLKFVT